MMMFAKECAQVDERLAAAARRVDPAYARERAFHMKTTLPLLGLAVPALRKIFNNGFSFSHLPFGEQLPIWAHVWANPASHEASLLPVYFLESLEPLPSPALLWPQIAPWAGGINCWDQSDGLSGVYSACHEKDPALVYPDLAAWNTSANPWERRQSLVSLFFYARVRAHQPPLNKVLPLVEARLADPHYYVQKGLGWCLRECFNAYPRQTLIFLNRHAASLAPAAWQAATEKLAPADKAALKKKRMRAKRRPALGKI
ncbi:MAG: DNA alkylation repair protein [Alphaproteobacteria bacterium]